MNDGPQPGEPAAPSATDDGPERDEALLAHLAGLRRALTHSVAETGERVQETVEDAVRRGRMTRKDAHELAAAIVASSRRGTDEIRQELEALLERGRRRGRRPGDDAGAAEDGPAGGDGAEEAGGDAVAPPTQRRGGTDRTLPIERYDELTAVLVRRSLAGLSPDELRAVRAHEAAHAKRKTVLAAVDRLLGA